MSKAYPNRHQYEFLRTLRRHPNGLPEALWPESGTLQRWLTQPRFRVKLGELLVACKLMAHLNAAMRGKPIRANEYADESRLEAMLKT